MKLALHLMFAAFLVVAITGCQRERYEMGNVKANEADTPNYTVTPDPNPPVKPK